jgi:hypothetical protein
MKLALAASLGLNVGLAIALVVSFSRTELPPDAPLHTAVEAPLLTTTDHQAQPEASDDDAAHKYQPFQNYQSSKY